MCSRLKLVWNIDEKTVEEVLAALARMRRLYLFLTLLSFYYIYRAVVDDDIFEIVYECCILILFVAYIYALAKATPLDHSISHTARIPKLKGAGFVVIFISIAYTAKMVYNALDNFIVVDLVLSLFSISIQISTLYVLDKLINKITFAEGVRDGLLSPA